jgi:hypothetical protein
VRRTLEVIFRHPWQLIILLVLCPVIGVATAYVLVPRTYSSTASLWALHRYEVISPDGPESDLNSTPAETQATALTDLLQTHAFVTLITSGIDLAPSLGLNPATLTSEQLQMDIFNNISKNVAIASPGYNLFTVTYTNRSPQIAYQIVSAIVKKFGPESATFSTQEGNDLLTSYNTQLQQAKQQESQAVAAEEQYIAANRNLSETQLQADPEYQQLNAAVTQAQTNVQNLETAITTIQESLGSNGQVNSLYQVVDAPQVPTVPTSRSKDFLVGGGVGLGVAILVAVIYLLFLVRGNRAIYSAYDLQDAVAVPVLFQLPTFTPTAISLLTADRRTTNRT